MFMNVGFDLDKIFINHPPLVPSWLINKLYGERVNGHLSYRIPGKIEQHIRKMSHVSFLRQPIKKNIAVLQEALKFKNINLFLISSRYSFLKPETEAIIKKNKFYNLFTEMIFNFKNKQPHRFKDEVITQKHIQRYVDDDLALLQFLSSKHPDIIFFWLNNKRSDKLKKNMYAITNLSSVFEKI